VDLHQQHDIINAVLGIKYVQYRLIALSKTSYLTPPAARHVASIAHDLATHATRIESTARGAHTMSAKRLLNASIALLSATVILFVAMLFLGGCGTVPHRPSFCADDEPSYIYDTAAQLNVDPANIGSLLVIANIEAIEHCPEYTEEAARGAVKNLRQLLAGGSPSYFELLTLAQQNITFVNDYAGREIMLLGLFMPVLSAKVPITDCDLKCFLYQLDKLEQSMDVYFGKKDAILRQWEREDLFFARLAVHYMRSSRESALRYERLHAAPR